ncbi:hypothetical protein [Streptomyces sp. NPDC047061]|uniref:hypothetical protein n=1 Tax=Streptomyces sp. NPDC047061 TaxID=3154605 RepID=UPI0033F44A84
MGLFVDRGKGKSHLFVVVVAIDPRWLLRCVAAHYRDVLHLAGGGPPDMNDAWISTPAQDLEKIFQLVLALPPVDDAGYARMLDALIAVPAPPAPAPRSVKRLTNSYGLLTAPRQITDAASAHQLDQPMFLGLWKPCAIPVARLSFPGQIVKYLRHTNETSSDSTQHGRFTRRRRWRRYAEPVAGRQGP